MIIFFTVIIIIIIYLFYSNIEKFINIDNHNKGYFNQWYNWDIDWGFPWHKRKIIKWYWY